MTKEQSANMLDKGVIHFLGSGELEPEGWQKISLCYSEWSTI